MGQKVLIYNLPNSIFHYHANEQREQCSLAPLPLTQDQVQQPTNAKMRKSERERMWFDHELAYAYTPAVSVEGGMRWGS